jgi:hypothetical protein
MKGIIDICGELSIVRGNRERASFCPHTESSERCGDWCPLFGEPKLHYADELHGYTTYLMLCHRTLEFDELIDERTNVKGKQT